MTTLHPLLGYFDEPLQTEPAHDPGIDVDCPVCVQPLDYPARAVRTVSLMLGVPGDSDDLSLFFRAHGDCWDALDPAEQGKYEGAFLDSRLAEVS